MEQRVEVLQERTQALRAKQAEISKLRRTQQMLVMTGHDEAAKTLETKRIIPLIRELGTYVPRYQ